jgi:hypothetical protein
MCRRRRITISCRLRSLRSLRRSRLAFASRDGNFERYAVIRTTSRRGIRLTISVVRANGIGIDLRPINGLRRSGSAATPSPG